MKQTMAIVLGIALLALVFCGGPKAGEKKDTPGADAPQGSRVPRRPPPEPPVQDPDADDSLRLREIRFTPARIDATSDLSAEPVLLQALPEDIEAGYEYRWYVNDEPLPEAEGPTLGHGSYAKGQWIFCEARASLEGRSGPWLHSKYVQVANALPQVAAAPLERFEVPGEIAYRIAASDPDGDPLTYELLSPLDQGIVLDPRTGELSWSLDAGKVEKLGQAIEIRFAVSDGDGGKTSGSITLNFTSVRKDTELP
ncbi:MAG: hypothetical protein JXO51_04520 [Candidatus Aminicenantes bacterium]|nr:hypothetical protein [Candidatus Aminicenantes bacterium]